MIKKINNQKFYTILLFILLILSQITILGFSKNSPLNYNYLKLNISQQINFDLNIGKDYKLDYLYLDSFFTPITYNGTQYLNSFKSNYKYEFMKNNLTDFNFLRYNIDSNNLKSSISINNNFVIQKIVDFPKITNESLFYNINKNKYKKFLSFGGFVDTNNYLKNIVENITYGKKDTFVIALDLAKWIKKNIKYDLKSELENPNQKATQIIQNKYGVCKEISILYVSMLRSLGIPARFVIGDAYTNSKELINYFNSNWGGHVWVEVLINNKWVPFDITYEEYGYIDPTHIITQKIPFIKNDSNVKVNLKAYNINFVPNTLKTNLKINIISEKNLVNHNLIFVNISGTKNLKFNSYGYFKIHIKNLENYYQVLNIQMIGVKGLKFLNISNNQEIILLKPFETKDLIIKFKIPNDLKKGYTYTLPFEFKTRYFDKGINVSVSNFGKYYLLKDLPNTLNNKIIFTNNPLNFSYYISTSKNMLILNCLINNKNNFEMKNISLCLNNNCKKFNLFINENKNFSFLIYKNINTINLTYFTKCKNNKKLNCKKTEKIYFEKPKLILKPIILNKSNSILLDINYFLENNFSNLFKNNHLSFKIYNKLNSLNKKIVFKKGELLINLSSFYFFKEKNLDNIYLTNFTFNLYYNNIIIENQNISINYNTTNKILIIYLNNKKIKQFKNIYLNEGFNISKNWFNKLILKLKIFFNKLISIF